MPSLRVERFIIARAEGTEFAVPAGAVAAIDIATEERWADLGADARGVLWEGRYLFVETIPGGVGADVRGRGEFAFLVVRTRLGLSALVIDRLLGEVLAVREPAPPPWDGQVRGEGSVYPVLPVAPQEEEPGSSGPEETASRVATREDDVAAHEAAVSGPEAGVHADAETAVEADAEHARGAVPASAARRTSVAKRGKQAKDTKRHVAPEPEPEVEPAPEAVTASEAEPADVPAPEPAAKAVQPPAPQSRPERGEAPHAGRRRRALVVDPRIGWRRGLAKRLRERGIEVREATRAGEFRGPAGVAFIGDLQTGVSPEAVAETLQALGWRAVLVTTQRPAEAGPFEAALVWPVRDEDLDSVLSMIGGDEDARGKNRSNSGGGASPT